MCGRVAVRVMHMMGDMVHMMMPVMCRRRGLGGEGQREGESKDQGFHGTHSRNFLGVRQGRPGRCGPGCKDNGDPARFLPG